MTKLTLARLRAEIAKDPRIAADIDLEEPGKAIVYTADGFTWDWNDGNRTVEGFLISPDNCDNDQQDTLAYFRQRQRAITEVAA
jgi:hypothetical protein